MKKSELLKVNINGNKKLINNAEKRFLIWNISAVITCPFSTALCRKACYALKAEKCYPSARKRRAENFELSKADNFAERMIETIEYYRASRAFKGRQMIVRIHESGDFYSKEYAEKWLAVIAHFVGDDSIIFDCYTKSLPFFEGVNLADYPNFAFKASVWADTAPEMLELIKKNRYRVYTAVESFETWDGAKCRCEDCATCGLCRNNKVEKIACEIH